ncbi:hypothetical protein AABB24_032114 [Solanum stoloniferum]|uniref:Uncharacterized protein n=1 Tax=Solanum stoloniferum TaxID=62892 RepID=A0ABD2RWF9_9SOLN
MGTTATPEEWPPDGQFPFDLFVSKKYKSFWDAGNIQFTDAVGNLFFSVDRRQPQNSAAQTHPQKLILDASDNTLIRIVRSITSLMYTLGFRKHFIPRNRFRVTIFPGFAELSLVVALVVIFFDKRKFWL